MAGLPYLMGVGMSPVKISQFRDAAAQTRKVLEGYGLPEVEYFLETFMDSFSLTLDQLK